MQWHRLLFLVAAVVLVGLPLALIASFGLGGSPGSLLLALVALVGSGVLAWRLADAERAVRRRWSVSSLLVGIIAWWTVGYFAWQWSQFARTVHNLELMRAYGRALDEHRDRTDDFPPSLEAIYGSLPAYVAPGRDEWGHPLVYESRPDGFVLVSHGRGGRPDALDPWSLREAGAHHSTCGDWSADMVLSDRGFHRSCGK